MPVITATLFSSCVLFMTIIISKSILAIISISIFLLAKTTTIMSNDNTPPRNPNHDEEVDDTAAAADAADAAVAHVLSLLQSHPLPPISSSSSSTTTSTTIPSITTFEYGTAGFRYNASVLPGVMVRVGLLCCRMLWKMTMMENNSNGNNNHGNHNNMGVMITASHNDESYNGVKISNPDGSMIGSEQEAFLVQWVNERDLNAWKEMLLSLLTSLSSLTSSVSSSLEGKNSTSTSTAASSMTSSSQPPNNNLPPILLLLLHVGRDTRSHSPVLSNLLIQGAQAMIRVMMAATMATNNVNVKVKVQVVDHGILTTPMLHHIVLYSNQPQEEEQEEGTTTSSTTTITTPPLASRQGYLNQMAQAYIDLDQDLNSNNNKEKKKQAWSLPPLQVDGACGVGYAATLDLQETLSKLNPSYAGRFQARNPPSTTSTSTSTTIHQSHLNDKCGSEHVQKQLQPPVWYDGDDAPNNNNNNNEDMPYACSVDGDADRIVFFATTTSATNPTSSSTTSLSTPTPSSPTLTLLDGDKIAVLIATFIKSLQTNGILPSSSSSSEEKEQSFLTLGVVQTAYANGASTKYLKDTLQIPVVITKTGVKHLHHAALQFDIGIYFEANGHGTVLFSERYHEYYRSGGGASNHHHGTTSTILSNLPKLINPAVGDALSDLLLVDLLLRHFGWTLLEWASGDTLYDDLPSRQLKQTVADRTIIQCNDNETQALTPPGLQAALDRAVQDCDALHGRCFVRPSGTENVVRIYAEASTRTLADELATKAAQIVYETCQGVGPLAKI